MEAQRAAFEAAVAQGRVGDFSRLGRGLLESARGAYASGPQYQSILSRVQEVVGGAIAGNDNAAGVVASLDNGFAASISIQQQMLEEMAALRGEIVTLRQDNARLNNRIEALIA